MCVGVGAPAARALSVSDLQAGASFGSLDGRLMFSDFEFTAVGFDESLFETLFVNPYDMGFRLILGLNGPFDPGSLDMSYNVSAASGLAIGGVRIPFVGVLSPVGSNPLAEVELETSNGILLAGSTQDFTSWQSIFSPFDPVTRIRVDEVVTLSGGKGTLKADRDFKTVPKEVPEPGTGLMLALGLGVWAAPRRRTSA